MTEMYMLSYATNLDTSQAERKVYKFQERQGLYRNFNTGFIKLLFYTSAFAIYITSLCFRRTGLQIMQKGEDFQASQLYSHYQVKDIRRQPRRKEEFGFHGISTGSVRNAKEASDHADQARDLRKICLTTFGCFLGSA